MLHGEEVGAAGQKAGAAAINGARQCKQDWQTVMARKNASSCDGLIAVV